MQLKQRLVFFAPLAAIWVAAFDGAACQVPLGRFTNVGKLGPNVNTDEYFDLGPEISTDGLTLYFFSNRPNGVGNYDLWQAKRASPDEPFGPSVNLGSAVNSSAFESAPAISPDGLTLYFRSTRSGNPDIYKATRATLNDEFADVVNVTALNLSSDEAPEHVDDLTLYLWSDRSRGEGGPDLYMACRESTDDPFTNPMTLGTGVNTPASEIGASVSSDGLVLFFSDGGDGFGGPRPNGLGSTDIWVATRDSVNDPFDNVVNLNDFGSGSEVNTPFGDTLPSVSSDWPAPGSRMYFHSNRPGAESVDILQATWVPHLDGDYSGNGTVEQSDLDLVLLNWGEDAATPPIDWISDLPDGAIDQDELDRVLLGWGTSFGSAASSVIVPEPTMHLLLLGTILAVLWNRRSFLRK